MHKKSNPIFNSLSLSLSKKYRKVSILIDNRWRENNQEISILQLLLGTDDASRQTAAVGWKKKGFIAVQDTEHTQTWEKKKKVLLTSKIEKQK